MDDINNVTSNNNKEELEIFVKDTHELTVNIYQENRLLVNDSKTQILQIEKNMNEAYKHNLQMISITLNTNLTFINIIFSPKLSVTACNRLRKTSGGNYVLFRGELWIKKTEENLLIIVAGTKKVCSIS